MRLPGLFENYRGRDIAYVAALGVVQAGLMMGAAFATRIVFSALSQDAAFPTGAIAALIAVPVCLALVQALARVAAERIGQSFAIDLRETVFRTIAALPKEERDRRSLGGLSLRFVGDMSAARGWAGLGVTRLISGAIVLPAAAATLWILNPALAVAGVVPIAVTMVAFVLIGRRLQAVHKGLRKRRANIAIWAMERIGQAHHLAAMGRLDRECRQLTKRGTRAADEAVARIRTTSVLRMIPNASLGLGSAAVLVTALTQGLATGETAAALAVLAILTIPLRQLVGVWDKHAAWTVARGKCVALIARAGPPTAVDNNAQAVTGLTLTGPDGAGSIEVTAGDAVILPENLPWQASLDAVQGDPSDVAVAYESETQPAVAVVSPRPVILKGSLRRALSMGSKTRPSDAELQDLIKVFGLDRFGLTDLDHRLPGDGKGIPHGALLRIAAIQAVARAPAVIAVDPALWSDPEAAALWGALVGQTTATVIAGPRPKIDCIDAIAA